MRFLRTHAWLFLLYIVCGSTALLLDFGLFFTLFSAGMWYVSASVIGGIAGFIGAFLLHKYVVFHADADTAGQFVRYCSLGAFNIVVTNVILYAAVEGLHVPEEMAKIFANGIIVLWNFFLYRVFVYA